MTGGSGGGGEDNNNKSSDGSKSSSNMTPDERLEWLRERVRARTTHSVTCALLFLHCRGAARSRCPRWGAAIRQAKSLSLAYNLPLPNSLSLHTPQGIEVVTPEERKASQGAQALRDADSGGQGGDGGDDDEIITYVLVPADPSKPMEEMSVATKSESNCKDLLVAHLKSKFRGGSGADDQQVDLSLLDESQRQTLAASADVKVSQSTLQSVAREGHVEVFALVHPTRETNYESVQIYLDEIGMLKRLPLNRRASDFALKAGYNPPPTFYGDVYLGKTVVVSGSGGGVVRSSSFKLAECRLDAPWLVDAVATNLQYQLERNKLTGQTGATQPDVVGAYGVERVEDSYSWTQTEEELEVRIELPKDGGTDNNSSSNSKAAAKKFVRVQFRPQSFDVSYRNKPLLAMRLFEKVDVDSGTWTVEESGKDGKLTITLVVSMEKIEQALWPRIRD